MSNSNPPCVNLYFCPLSSSLIKSEIAATVRSWLPQDEIDKVDRYIQQTAKVQGLMVRGYLRALLSHHGKLQPDEWQFEYGEKGKPRLTQAQFERTGIDFNLSHSGDWLLLAIHQQPVEDKVPSTLELGVDIERCRTSTNIHSILNHYFSEPETAALLALPNELQRDRFFDLWALKESYIKAKGLGLALSLKSFGFDLSTMEQRILALKSSEHTKFGQLKSGFSQQMVFKQGVALQLFSSKTEVMVAATNDTLVEEAANWHCALGHLDDDYRFAISVKGLSCQHKPIEYDAEIASINDVVKAMA
ncbi:4-phosphopantetheinyl transferase [Shewanella sp. Choline-02u-19]|uniref:4'-phosphopantetheinyl transferase family protein n=1 Tax=unclassified Shewanella TaxID=196818 RepID=UPI000C31FA52|nr:MULTISPECIES: 4'-phosphopantetheinyl transferase superfamily protein [unclassified Shewanella]PKH54911.1 4-phosphopantetheinyl transferase [Shewanella sp. Bg11-22]PKI26683.1 4-phosphopantetheinyl transferase [Shewanella sp. Choline-02u-19]